MSFSPLTPVLEHQLNNIRYHNFPSPVEREAYRQRFSAQTIRSDYAIAGYGGYCLVTAHEGIISSYVIVQTTLEGGCSLVEISDLWVQPRQRHTGLATNLLTEVFRRAHEIQPSRVRVNVSPRNNIAINLYEKFGLRPGTLIMDRLLN